MGQKINNYCKKTLLKNLKNYLNNIRNAIKDKNIKKNYINLYI